MKQSLEVKLLNYLDTHVEWHRKIDLYVLGSDLGYSPEGVGRALRSLAHDGKIRYEYYKGRFAPKLVRYASLLAEPKYVHKPTIIKVDGVYKAIV